MRNKIEAIALKIDPKLFQDYIGSYTKPEDEDLDPSTVGVVLHNCLVKDFCPGSFNPIPQKVGDIVHYQEDPCPMDNCNALEAQGVQCEVVAMGTLKQVYGLQDQQPTEQVWFYIQ